MKTIPILAPHEAWEGLKVFLFTPGPSSLSASTQYVGIRGSSHLFLLRQALLPGSHDEERTALESGDSTKQTRKRHVLKGIFHILSRSTDSGLLCV